MPTLPDPLRRVVDVLAASPEFAGKVQLPDEENLAEVVWVGDCGCGHCRCAWACFTVDDGDSVLNLSFRRGVHPNYVAQLVRVLTLGQIPHALYDAWKVSQDGEILFESDGYRRPQ